MYEDSLVRFTAYIKFVGKRKKYILEPTERPKLFSNIDQTGSPFEKYTSPVFTVRDKKVILNDSIIISLPPSIDLLGDFLLSIEIE